MRTNIQYYICMDCTVKLQTKDVFWVENIPYCRPCGLEVMGNTIVRALAQIDSEE